ncbi:MAG: hypothetical protein HN341_12125 [Verrucomicrobia bacterium]|jgi:hypothetical protein|nr:hypothetical protein [Verrucomicrobiota bacterium]
MKKRDRGITMLWAAIAVGLFIPLLTVQAATRTWDGGGGDSSWINDDNWSDNTEPGPDDFVVIGGTAVVNYDRVSPLHFNSTAPIDINDTATLNLTTGALSYISSTGNDSPITVASGAVLNISDGTHSIGGRQMMFSSGIMRVTGSDATINMFQMPGFNGTFDFVFDAVGVSSLDYNSWMAGGAQGVTVDASAYTGSSKNFTLIQTSDTANGLINPLTGTISVIPPSASWSSTVTQVTGSKGNLTLTLLEPGTILYDDFRTNGLANNTIKRNSQWAGSSDWSWTSGTLENTNTTKGVGICFPVPAGITTENALEIDLGYAVANGSTAVAMHMWGLKDVSSSSTTEIMNPWGTAGMWYAGGGNLVQYNLKDGATGYNSTPATAAVQIPSDTGAGLSYSTTLKLGGLGSGLSKLSDYDYIAVGFQKHSYSPDLSIDEVSIRALLPSGTVISIR